MQQEEDSLRAAAARMRIPPAAASTPLQAFTPTAAAKGRPVGPDAAAVDAGGGRAAAKQVVQAPRRSRGTSEPTASSKFGASKGGRAMAAAGDDENGEAEGAPHTEARESTAAAAAAEAPQREIRCRALLAAAQEKGSANVEAEEVIAALPRSAALSRGVRRALGACAAGIRADEQHAGIAAKCRAAEGEAEELSGGVAAVFSKSRAAQARADGKAVVATAEAAGQSGAAIANADGIGRLSAPTGFTNTFSEWWIAGWQWKHKGNQQNQAAACLRAWHIEQSRGTESRRMQEIVLRGRRDEGVAATGGSDAAAEVAAIVKATISLPVIFTPLCGGRVRRYTTDAPLSSFRKSNFLDLQSERSPASAVAAGGTAATPRIAGAAEATTQAVDRGIAQVKVHQEASGTRGAKGSVAARALQKKGPDEKTIEKSNSSLFRRERGWPAEKRERLRRRFNQCKRLHAFLRSRTCMHNVLSNSFLEATGGMSYSEAAGGSVDATSNCQAPTTATAAVHAHPLRGEISSVYGSAPAHDEEASVAAIVSSTTAEADAKRGVSDQAEGASGDAAGARNENAAAEVNEDPAAAATTTEDLELCTRGEFSVAVSVLSTYSKLLLQEQQRVEQDEHRSSDNDSSFSAATTQAPSAGADVSQGAGCRARFPAAAAAQRVAAASMQLLDPTALLLPPLFLPGRRRQPFLITSSCGLPLKHIAPLSADTKGNRQQLSPQRRIALEQDKRLPAVERERQTPEKRKLQLQSSCVTHGCHHGLPQYPPADSHSHTNSAPHMEAVNNNTNEGIKEEQLQSIARATGDVHALQQQQSTTAGATVEARQRKHQLLRPCHMHARQQYTPHKSRTGVRGAALEQQQKKQQQAGKSSGDGVVCQQVGGVDTRIRMNQSYDGVTPESRIYKKPSLARLVVIFENLKRRQQETHVEAATSNEFQPAGKLHLQRLQRHDPQQQQYKHSQRMEQRKEEGNVEQRKRWEEQHSTPLLRQQHDELQKPDQMTEDLIQQENMYAWHTHQHKEGHEAHAHLRYQQQWRQQSEKNSPSGGPCAAEEQHQQALQQQKKLPNGLRAERMPAWTQKRRGAVSLHRLRGLGGRRGFIVQQRQKSKKDRNARKEEAAFVEQYHARDAEEKKTSLVRGSYTDRRHSDVSMFQEHAKVKKGHAGDTKQKRRETEELEERVYTEELRSYLLHRSRSLQHLELETILGNFLERHIYHFSLHQLHELHVLLHLDTTPQHSSSGSSLIHSRQKSATSSNSEEKSSGAHIDSSNVNEYNFTETGSSTIIRSRHHAFRSSSSSHTRGSYSVGKSSGNTLSDPANTKAGGIAPPGNTSIQATAGVAHLSSTERTGDEDSTVDEKGTASKKESGIEIVHKRHCSSSAASAGPGLATAAAEAEAPGRKYTAGVCAGERTHSSANATAAESGALRQRKSTYEKNGLLFALMSGAVQEVPGKLRANSVLLLLLQYVFSDHPLLQQFKLRPDA